MVGHAWRSLLFGIDGWRHYMKAGYERAAKSFDNSHLARDLTGRHVMVTGANSGIGYETARQLALQGATVCMVCRDRQRGTDARDAIRAEIRAMSVGPRSNVLEKNTKSAADDDDSHSARVSLRVCDVSSQRAVRDLVTAYVESGNPLHVLVNNAGCMVHDFRETDEGLEVNFATNAVGPFTLTEGLLPILRRSGVDANEPSRVICVSSAGMLTEKLELDDPEMRKVPKFDGTRQYAKNKRFQVAMCEAWTKREQASARHDDKEVAVAFYSHHPGWSDTDAVRSALPGFYDTLKGRLRSPLEGADTVIWLAAVDQTNANATKTKQKTKALESGGFYFDRQSVAKHVGATFFATTRYSQDDVKKMERLLVAARDAALERKSFSA